MRPRSRFYVNGTIDMAGLIEEKHGDILHAETEALVNTVNCVGVMGRGIALQFKKAFPENYKIYKHACDDNQLAPGKMLIWNRNSLESPQYIINFPTKIHWRGSSEMEFIESGLKALVEEVKRLNIRSIAVPPLGCSLGGLQWEDVRPRIVSAFSELPDVKVAIYPPEGAPAAETMAKDSKVPKMTPGRAVLIELIRQYLSALMDSNITLLELHKLALFAQAAGQPLKLKYTKGRFGPYAENLRHALNAMEGHFIKGFGDGSDDPRTELELIPGTESQVAETLGDLPDTQMRLMRVHDLISGFETPFGMELLSTVYWVMTEEGATSDEEIINKVHSWNTRKQMFTSDQIVVAARVLRQQKWIS